MRERSRSGARVEVLVALEKIYGQVPAAPAIDVEGARIGGQG